MICTTIPPNGWLVVCLAAPPPTHLVVLPCRDDHGVVHVQNSLDTLAKVVGDLKRRADEEVSHRRVPPCDAGLGRHEARLQVFELGPEMRVGLDYKVVKLEPLRHKEP